MPKYEFVADKEELMKSEAFKNDDITQAIDELNKNLYIAKCRGIKLELTDEWKEKECLVEVNGFILRHYTVAKLMTAGIVKIKEVA